MYHKFTFTFLLAACVFTAAQAQVATKADISRLKAQVNEVINLRNTSNVITPSAFDQKLDSVLNTVSGSTYQNGKATQTSASADDKGLTVNYNIIDNEAVTWQFTASGKSTKGVVDLFSDGKYSRTLTGGFNLFFFPATNAAFPAANEKLKINAAIDHLNRDYNRYRSQHFGQNEILSMKAIFDTYGTYFYSATPIPSALEQDYDAKKATFKALLKKYAFYLPKDFESLALAEQTNAINDLAANTNAVIDHYYYKQELDTLNKIQLALKWDNTYVNWWMISAKINHDAYPIYDAAEKTYTHTFDDFYPSLSLSYNFAIIGQKSNKLFMPTLKFQNNRDFKAGNMLYLDIPQNQRTIGSQTVYDYKQTSYYNAIADRKSVFNFEAPFTLFFPKARVPFGFDLSLNTNLNDASNIGGRFGVYVSLSGAKQNVIIEPLIRVNQWKSGDSSFSKDQVSFGINLTVALPSYITGQK